MFIGWSVRLYQNRNSSRNASVCTAGQCPAGEELWNQFLLLWPVLAMPLTAVELSRGLWKTRCGGTTRPGILYGVCYSLPRYLSTRRLLMSVAASLQKSRFDLCRCRVPVLCAGTSSGAHASSGGLCSRFSLMSVYPSVCIVGPTFVWILFYLLPPPSPTQRKANCSRGGEGPVTFGLKVLLSAY